MNKYQCLHETPITAAIDLIKTFDKLDVDEIFDKTKRSPYASTSIARIASNMTLVFPVMCSTSLSIDTDIMIMKAIERKCCVMLQILFSAYQVSDVEDAQEFINRFHSNIRLSGKATVDDFIALGDALSENTSLTVDKGTLNRLSKDFRENCFFVFEDDIAPKSIGDMYNESASTSSGDANYRGRRHAPHNVPTNTVIDVDSVTNADGTITATYYDGNDANHSNNGRNDRNRDRSRNNSNINRDNINSNNRDSHNNYFNNNARDSHNVYNNNNSRTYNYTTSNNNNDEHYSAKDMKDMSGFFQSQILDNDVKKANELVPMTMVVNFKYLNPETGRSVPLDNIVIGVKARMIPVESEDIVNHVLTKLKDKNFVTQLIRATTREISFFKDFIFAVDNAKIEALANSKRGSANQMWKVLERRARMSRLKRFIGVKGNNCNAISTLVISQEEVDYVRKNYGTNLDSVKNIEAILDAYNLMCFVVVDESLETAKFLFDTGEGTFETLSFTSLEREASDNSYKKIINLMSKIS